MAPVSLAIDKASLPRSVRGIDQAHLRRAIRRKQNSESARRCRARRRQARLLASVTGIGARTGFGSATGTTSGTTISHPRSPMQMSSAPSTPPLPPTHHPISPAQHPLPLPPQDRILQLEHLVRTLSHQLAMAQAQCATLLTMRDPTSVQATAVVPPAAPPAAVSTSVSLPTQVPLKTEAYIEHDAQEREEFLAAIDQLAEL